MRQNHATRRSKLRQPCESRLRLTTRVLQLLVGIYPAQISLLEHLFIHPTRAANPSTRIIHTRLSVERVRSLLFGLNSSTSKGGQLRALTVFADLTPDFGRGIGRELC